METGDETDADGEDDDEEEDDFISTIFSDEVGISDISRLQVFPATADTSIHIPTSIEIDSAKSLFMKQKIFGPRPRNFTLLFSLLSGS